jgi:hypothetical protein
MKIIRLTNFDDWEAYYQMDDETDRWKVFDQGHHVRVADLLNHLGIYLETLEIDFADYGWYAPDEVTEELLDKMRGQN